LDSHSFVEVIDTEKYTNMSPELHFLSHNLTPL